MRVGAKIKGAFMAATTMLCAAGWPSCDSFTTMFMVTEAEADAIRRTYAERGEWPAVVELRRLAPGITDNSEALRCVRVIVGWRPQAPKGEH